MALGLKLPPFPRNQALEGLLVPVLVQGWVAWGMRVPVLMVEVNCVKGFEVEGKEVQGTLSRAIS
jgi:hypothetical protein